MKKIYSAEMVNTGGRTGESHAPDGSLALKIAPPGGGGEHATNPEQLFAAGYGACFHSALKLVMQREKIQAESTVTAVVSLYEREPFDYVLGVEITGHIAGVSTEKAEELLQKAHAVCPYSKATRGNIEVSLKAV